MIIIPDLYGAGVADSAELSSTQLQAIEALKHAAPVSLQPRGGTLVLAISEEQKRILRRYGSVLCIDATYRTCSWGLPFFMLVVVDSHHKAYPVAYFMISHETKEAVTEVLLYLKHLVPNWEPNAVIMDKDEAEIQACKLVFPNAVIILCEFHAKQAWLRWLRTSAHGVTKDRQLYVYKCLNGIMKSPSTQVALGRVSLTDTLNNPTHSKNLSCSPENVSV